MDIFSFFLGFNSGLAILFALGEFFSNKSSKNLYLGFIFLFLSIFLLQSFLWSSGLIKLYPNLLHLHLPTTALLGAFLERYFVLMWENQFESIKQFVIKCFFSLSVLLFVIPVYLMQADEKLNYIESSYNNGFPLKSKLVVLVIIGILFYFFISLSFRFKNLFRSSTFYSSKTLQLIFSVLVIGFVGIFIGGYFAYKGSYAGMTANGCMIGVFLILLYILRLRFPEIFQEVRKIIEEEKKYKNSQLKSLDLEKVSEKINTLFEKEKIYLEENLNLTELAQKVGITNHQLSEYLNQELKVSFFQLINRYRIETAKQILIESPKETILSIAYKVGFQSKSSFNEIFKKETGFTPSEFRKKQKMSPNLSIPTKK